MAEERSKLWYLENFSLFRGLSRQEMDAVCDVAVMQDIAKDTFIYFSPDDARYIHFLKKGQIKLVNYSDDGDEMIKAIMRPGEVFGELSLMEQGSYDEAAIALTDCLLCKMGGAEMQAIMQKNITFTTEILKLIGLKLRRIERRLENIAFKDARTRITEFLFDFAREYGERRGRELVVKNFLKHQDIANLTATSRQTVTTILNDLKQQGIIKYDRRKMILKDVDAFAAPSLAKK